MSTIAQHAATALMTRDRADNHAVCGLTALAINRPQHPAHSTFSWVMRLLPARRRNAVQALAELYRALDDLARGEASPVLKSALLSNWRSEIACLFAGQPQHDLTRALLTPIRDYDLRCNDFLAVIEGMEMDARRPIRAPSEAELDLYCAHLAVAAGRLSICILGVEAPAAERLAAELGRAVQLTETLRNLVADAGRHRLYLPRDLLDAHGIFATNPANVLAHPALPAVCDDLAARAGEHYRAAREALLACRSSKTWVIAAVLQIQSLTLEALVARGWRHLDEPVRLPAWRQAVLVIRCGLLGR